MLSFYSDYVDADNEVSNNAAAATDRGGLVAEGCDITNCGARRVMRRFQQHRRRRRGLGRRQRAELRPRRRIPAAPESPSLRLAACSIHILNCARSDYRDQVLRALKAAPCQPTHLLLCFGRPPAGGARPSFHTADQTATADTRRADGQQSFSLSHPSTSSTTCRHAELSCLLAARPLTTVVRFSGSVSSPFRIL